MRAVVQRVASASVKVEGKVVSEISRGLVILLGVSREDGVEDARVLASKLSKLRIFEDEQGKMNLSPAQVGAEFLVVSNFTLQADISHGNRPDFFGAQRPDTAQELYLFFAESIEKESGLTVKKGVFGADMKLELINDGPVTIVAESKDLIKRK